MRTALFAAVLVPVLAGAALAESHDAETVALGFQTEHADLVAVTELTDVVPRGESGLREATFKTVDVLRGRALVGEGESLTVVFADLGAAPPWREGARHLVFLTRRAEGPSPSWNTVTGTFGIRVLVPGGPESRFPAVVSTIAGFLGDGAEVTDPSRYREQLVRWTGDRDPGIAWSAATDLLRHRQMHRSLTPDEGDRIVTAFRTARVGKKHKNALAMAAAVTGRPTAGPALVESLLGPRERWIRGTVGSALARLRDPAVPGLLRKALADATPRRKATLVQALGRVGVAQDAPTVRVHLTHEVSEVRIEAAHALGLVARRVRRADPEARVGGSVELSARILLAEGKNERKAMAWALAQLDEPQAYGILRRLAKSAEQPDVRRYAASFLERPRVSLVLR